MRHRVTSYSEPFAAAFGMPPFLFYEADWVIGYGQPFNPFAVGYIGIRPLWFGWAAINKLCFVTLSTKGAIQG